MNEQPSPDPSSDYCKRSVATDFALAISSLTLLATTILVPLRLYTRLWIVHGFWWDDILITVSYLIFIAASAIFCQIFSLGIGSHAGCFPVAATSEAGRLIFILEIVVTFCQVASRASVALFVTRIFAVTRRVRNLLYAFVLWMSISLIVTGAATFSYCTPAESLWNPALAPVARCWPDAAKNFILFYYGSVSIVSDFVLACLPVYFLVMLKMSRSRRHKLIALMSVGMIPGICAVSRLAVLWADLSTTTDIPYVVGFFALAENLETGMLIIAAIIPALPPVFQKERRDARYAPSWQDISLRRNPFRRSYHEAGSKDSSNAHKSEAPVATQSQNLSNVYVVSYHKEADKEHTSCVEPAGVAPEDC